MLHAVSEAREGSTSAMRLPLPLLSLSLVLSALSLIPCCQCVVTHVNQPNTNWDKGRFVPARIGNGFWWHGSATYYASYGSSGACGFPLKVTDNIYHAAVPDPRWSNSLTAGAGGFSGSSCGQCFQIKCLRQPRFSNSVYCNPGAQPIVIRVTDCDTPKPGGWPPNHFDLNPPAFNAIADPNAGIINIKFRRVHCETSGAKWTLGSDSNGFYHDMTIYDVPGVGAIVGVMVQPAGMGWQKASWSWGSRYILFGAYSVGSNTQVQLIMSENRGSTYASYFQTN